MTYLRIIIGTIILLVLTSGCSGLTENMADNLAAAIRNNNDLETVKVASPSYLIMLDAFLQGDPENEDLLRVAANMYSGYTEAFVKDHNRVIIMTDKAFQYAQQACCNYDENLCLLTTSNFQAFSQRLALVNDKDDLPFIFTLGKTWASWIQARRDNLTAMAQIAKVEALMVKVTDIDETYMDGAAHLYLGALAIILPPSIGGQPEIAKKHFDRAIELSEGRNLMAKVIYAEKYGRMMFDQQLHDRLLNEVLAANHTVTGYTLSNIFAQQRARELLATGRDYF